MDAYHGVFRIELPVWKLILALTMVFQIFQGCCLQYGLTSFRRLMLCFSVRKETEGLDIVFGSWSEYQTFLPL